jgi:hypothetical protein
MTGATLESYLVEIVDALKNLTWAVVAGIFVLAAIAIAGKWK